MIRARLFIAFAPFLIVMITVMSMFACSGRDDGAENAAEHFSLRIVQGNLQAGLVGEDLGTGLRVLATLADGSPAVGRSLRFSILSGLDEGAGEALLDPEVTETGPDGTAICTVRAASAAGILRVRAASPGGHARPVTFHCSIYPRPTETRRPICLLSINDFHTQIEPWGPEGDHQGGIARIARAFQAIREANSLVGVPTVIFDAGDDFENTAYHDVPGMLAWQFGLWDRVSVDAWQVGNHDCNLGLPFLTEQIEGGRLERMNITFGNVDPSTLREDLVEYAALFETDFTDTGSEKLFQQTTIVDADGIRVGVVGVMTSQGTQTPLIGDPMFLKIIGGSNPYAEKLTFFNPDPEKSDYIARAIDSLVYEGADVVVVLSHAGLGFEDRANLPPGVDDRIASLGAGAETGRAIDLLISGHSHVQLNHPIYVENPAGGTTPIVQAREGGLFIARVDAVVDLTAGGLDVIDSRLLQVNADLEEDLEVAGEVAQWHEAVCAHYEWHDRLLANSATFLSHRAQTISGFGNLLNNAFLWKMEDVGMPMDLSIVIPSLYRRDLWPGPVTGAMAHGVLSQHQLDETGTTSDSLCILTFRPGAIHGSTLLVPGTWKRDTTALEYLLEFIHTINQIGEVIPALGDELKVDTIQIGGIYYEVDLTADLYEHIVPGSIRINGMPVDPDHTYRLVTVQTFASIMAPAINTLLVGYQPGEGFVQLLLDDPETCLPYIDTGIPIWQGFLDYLEGLPGGEVPGDEITVTGQTLVTEQPDLVINPSEIVASAARRGHEAAISMRVRNIGKQPIREAHVRLLVDVTPWDLTDHDDGRAELEGLGEDYLGSLVEVGRREISVGAHPDFVDVEFIWSVPLDLPAGMYTLHPRIEGVLGEDIDPNTGEPYTDLQPDNDSGEQVMVYFEILD